MKAWSSGALLGQTRRQSLLRVALLVALCGLGVWGWSSRRAGTTDTDQALDVYERADVTELAAGQRAPALRLRRFPDGAATDLDDFRDKLVVLNFWATWCTPCAAEMPALESLWTEYRGRGLVVLGVAEDRDAPASVLAPYIAHLGLTFPVLADPDQRAGEDWRVTGLPTTFLIRPGGEVAAMAVGARRWSGKEMQALIDGLLRP
jgi:peroxiredoxin